MTSYNFETVLAGAAVGALGTSADSLRMTGTYVTAPQRAATLTSDGFPFGVDGSPVSTTYTVIGDDVWLGIGDAAKPVPQPRAAELAASLDSILPGALLASDISSDAYEQVRKESRNGVPATLWRAKATLRDIDATGAVKPGAKARWTSEVWLADAGYPVAWAATLTGDGVAEAAAYRSQVDLTDIDDPTLSVQAPQ